MLTIDGLPVEVDVDDVWVGVDGGVGDLDEPGLVHLTRNVLHALTTRGDAHLKVARPSVARIDWRTKKTITVYRIEYYEPILRFMEFLWKTSYLILSWLVIRN